MFVGIPDELEYENDVKESDAINLLKFTPLDYLWYPSDTKSAKNTYKLNNPALFTRDLRFIERDNTLRTLNYEVRGRTTIEHALLKVNSGMVPTLYVFTLRSLLIDYKSNTVRSIDWNSKFAAYFPDIKNVGPEPFMYNDDDNAFGQKIMKFIESSRNILDKVNDITGSDDNAILTVSGIKQIMFLWNKPVDGFEGAANLFYSLRVTNDRPYFRLIPPQGTAITKLHVKGVLPIPTLEHPEIIEQWAKDKSPTPTDDFFTIKYLHRPSIGITPPIYGTIQILNDSTIKLLLQPPKSIRKLDPIVDFRNFSSKIESVFDGLPQMYNSFEIKEISAIFMMKIKLKELRFTKNRIVSRLPYFQPFFREITPLPQDNPLISLKYKAVSQYASQDKIFIFIKQFITSRQLEKGTDENNNIITAIQNEFHISHVEATDILTKWHSDSGTLTVEEP
jgi:hypothetical protein